MKYKDFYLRRLHIIMTNLHEKGTIDDTAMALYDAECLEPEEEEPLTNPSDESTM